MCLVFVSETILKDKLAVCMKSELKHLEEAAALSRESLPLCVLMFDGFWFVVAVHVSVVLYVFVF